jgi:hypothetical protein
VVSGKWLVVSEYFAIVEPLFEHVESIAKGEFPVKHFRPFEADSPQKTENA